MRFTPREGDPVFDSIKPVVQGLGMALVDVSVSRHKRSVQVRAVIYKVGTVGVEDCSQVHKAILPRLELAFPGQDILVEVSSPGIDRLIKDGSELVHYIGRGIKCFRRDISDWSAGILKTADETHLVLEGKDGMIDIAYEHIAKAKLDYSQEV
ncbi:MAG: ribosome assembly cofactor RimP [Treponema sp.]|jgi:ribosome maturation factor RimP|nr:ribosome assembly cofactor RimP [Treponema sp.]